MVSFLRCAKTKIYFALFLTHKAHLYGVYTKFKNAREKKKRQWKIYIYTRLRPQLYSFSPALYTYTIVYMFGYQPPLFMPWWNLCKAPIGVCFAQLFILFFFHINIFFFLFVNIYISIIPVKYNIVYNCLKKMMKLSQ